MCGIVGYVGERRASPILLEGLRMLEYRGYDSAGIAAISGGKITVRKATGKVGDVAERLGFSELEGETGIAHTRWATTGNVTDANAHPHLGDRFAIVHNGIVENYQDLKKEVKRPLKSETDTEVVLALIEQTDGSLESIAKVFRRLHGRNAFVLLDGQTGKLVGIRKGSPLVLGIAPDGTFLASDVTPLIEHTRDIVFLDDNELVVINDGHTVYDVASMKGKEKDVTEIDWTVEQARKGDYDHYMLKEIMEQKTSIRDAIAQEPDKIEKVARMIRDAFGTYVVACGSAGKVALASTYIFSSVAKHHLNHAIGSEFPNYHDFLTDKSLLVAISQSGETADTLEAVETMRDVGGKVVSIVNVLGSTMDRVADETVPVRAGPEKSVCSTKATTGQLAIMYLLAYAVAGRTEEGRNILKETADAIDRMLTDEFLASIEKLAASLQEHESMYIIGRGQNYPIALESAIKIQEVSYIHAEGFAAGELKHGPIALIGEGTPLIALVPNDDTREDVITNALEVKARGGRIIGVSPEDNDAFDDWIRVPDLPVTSTIANLIPVQLLAYYLAVARGTDVDQPRNLAKSVTVK